MGMDDNDKKGNEEGSRARNRTVMLTPDVTSQVRNRLAQELGDEAGANVSRGGFEPAVRGQFSASPGRAAADAPPARVAPTLARAVQAPVEPVDEKVEGVFWAKESPIVGFLVAYDRQENGEVFELRSGRIMVTSAARPDENSMVLVDDTVSSMHAILRVSQEGSIQVLDQLSEHGTSVTREDGTTISLSGDKGEINHGDVVSFGARAFHVCLVPRRKTEE